MLPASGPIETDVEVPFRRRWESRRHWSEQSSSEANH
jgi:hypothetical protein